MAREKGKKKDGANTNTSDPSQKFLLDAFLCYFMLFGSQLNRGSSLKSGLQ